MKNLIILGASGFGREIFWLVREINAGLANSAHQEYSHYKVLGFISEDPDQNWSADVDGLPVLGNDAWAFENLDRNTVFVCAIGDPQRRKLVAQRYLDAGFKPETLIHPAARMAKSTQIGRGSLVCAGAVLTTDVRLGNFGIVNLNTTVGHDCNIGDYVTLSPGVNVSGAVSLGDLVEVGSGATLVPEIAVGAGAKIGAGAVVVSDLEGGQTYAGVPARALRQKD